MSRQSVLEVVGGDNSRQLSAEGMRGNGQLSATLSAAFLPCHQLPSTVGPDFMAWEGGALGARSAPRACKQAYTAGAARAAASRRGRAVRGPLAGASPFFSCYIARNDGLSATANPWEGSIMTHAGYCTQRHIASRNCFAKMPQVTVIAPRDDKPQHREGRHPCQKDQPAMQPA